TVKDQPVRFGGASHSYANAGFGAAKVGAQYCFDDDTTTGWSTTDRPGQPHEAVFNFAQPVDLNSPAMVRMLFSRHYACGLGRFRLSVTTATKRAEATSH